MNNPAPSQRALSPGQFSYERWREHFLRILLRGTCVLGGIAILLYLIAPYGGLMKVLAVLTYGILVLITVLNSVSYRWKALIFLLLLYFAGISSLLDYGAAGASILFLGFIAMAALLFESRTSIYIAIGVTFATVLGLGWINTPVAEWARLTALLFIVSAILVIGLHTFQEEFVKAQEIAKESFEAIQAEHSTLEQRVEERTAILARKAEHLRATSYIARQTAEVQDLASLLKAVSHLVTDQFGFYHTGIFLINETGDQAVLHAASSEGGARMIQRGYSMSVGTQGIVGYVAAQKRPRVVLDVGEDAVFFNNPDLPMTRSEVALPLNIRNKVLGVLDIQSEKPQAFTVEDVDVFQTLADQVAIAIENARLMDETQAALIQLEALTGIRTREAWDQKLRGKTRTFTYTPLGMRTEKVAQSGDKGISAAVTLRGQKIGDISIARKSNAAWSKLDQNLLEEIASQVGLAVENIRLLEEATQRAKHEQTVGMLAARFSQSLDLDTLLQTAARELGQLPDISEVSVFIGQETEQSSAPKQRSKRKTS